MKLLSYLLFLFSINIAQLSATNLLPPPSQNELIFDYKDASKKIQIQKTTSAFKINLQELPKAKLRLAFDIKSCKSEDKSILRRIKSKKYLHAKKYPSVQFIASRIYKSNQHYKIDGKLYIKDAIVSVTVPITIQDLANEVHRITGTLKILCKDIGINCKDISRKIKINFEIHDDV